MPAQSTSLNTDTAGILTSSYFGNPGDGSSVWYFVAKLIEASASNATTTALAASLVVKASAGVLLGFQGVNTSASPQYIQVHDAASLPADTAVPKMLITVPAGENFSLDLGRGRVFTTGIVICNSSTAATKTIGSADCWIDAQYL